MNGKREAEKATAYLKKMDGTPRENWENNWNHVVTEYNSYAAFPPKNAMIQRMADFFREFLNSLSEGQIYPKVIVMLLTTLTPTTHVKLLRLMTLTKQSF